MAKSRSKLHGADPTKGRRRRFYKRKGFWFTLMFLAVLGGVVGWVGFQIVTEKYRQRAEIYDLDKVNELEVPSTIYDRNDKEIGRIYVENRSYIPLEQIPDKMIRALKAGEDSRFDKHNGVDYFGILRAAKANFGGEVNQGASTLTQQLARNAYDLKGEAVKRQESSYERKAVEAFLAMRIEKRYKKSEILEFYLNRVYFGSGFYGIRSAALGYFGKEPRDLEWEECATIVGVIKSPNQISPLNNIEKATKSRNNVLKRLAEVGFITKSERDTLQAKPIRLNPRPLSRGTTHFYERVSEELTKLRQKQEEASGEGVFVPGGFKIYTTLDSDIQKATEKALEESLMRAERHRGYEHQRHAEYRKNSGKPPTYLQGAALMVDHGTGEVLAYVGGRDYAQAPFDFIQQGRRPLGTLFLPFVYAAGFERNLTPATSVLDDHYDNRFVMVGGSEGIIAEWGMEVPSPNLERKDIPARQALEQSKIGASIRFGSMVGLDKVRETSRRFGLPIPDGELLPRILVGWEQASMPEVTRAFGAIARGGDMGAKDLMMIRRVEDPSGAVVLRNTIHSERGARVTDSATAYQIHSIMASGLRRSSAAEVTATIHQRPFNGAGKTGTTHDFSDNWFAGYNSRISCAVWAGFLQGSGKPIYEGAFSHDIAMPVWVAAMNAAEPAFGGKEIQKPATIVEVDVCRASGQRATPYCYEPIEDPETGVMKYRKSSMVEYFRQGTENVPFCTLHSGDAPGSGTPVARTSRSVFIDAIPIRPKAPALVGNDPYNAEPLNLAPANGQSAGAGVFRKRTTSVESLDLGDESANIQLPRPERLDIDTD